MSVLACLIRGRPQNIYLLDKVRFLPSFRSLLPIGLFTAKFRKSNLYDYFRKLGFRIPGSGHERCLTSERLCAPLISKRLCLHQKP